MEERIGPLGPSGDDYVTINTAGLSPEDQRQLMEILGSTVTSSTLVGEALEANNTLSALQNELLAKQVKAINYLSFTVLALTVAVIILIVLVVGLE